MPKRKHCVKLPRTMKARIASGSKDYFHGTRVIHRPTRMSGIVIDEEKDVLDHVTHLIIKTDLGENLRDTLSAFDDL